MDDNWFIPGGAYVTDDVKLRLRPPQSWHKVELEIPRVPPSMNVNEIRSHWSGFQKQKKSWQEEIGLMLMAQRVQRHGYLRALAGGFLRFPRKAAQRDTNNFTTLLTKALGDALGSS